MMWDIAPNCRGRSEQREARMDHKKPQKDNALTQAFSASVIMDNLPGPFSSAITNAIPIGIILNELTGNIAVAYADCSSAIIIHKPFGHTGTAMPNYSAFFNMEKTTVKPTNAVPSAF